MSGLMLPIINTRHYLRMEPDMDLINLKPTSETVEVLLVHPSSLESLTNADGSEMSITVYAPHTKEYKAVAHEHTNRRISKASKKRGTSSFSAEDLEKEVIDLLSRTTKSWDITYSGKKPKMTVELCKEVYTELFWIKDQIDEAVSDSIDFTKA